MRNTTSVISFCAILTRCFSDEGVEHEGDLSKGARRATLAGAGTHNTQSSYGEAEGLKGAAFPSPHSLGWSSFLKLQEEVSDYDDVDDKTLG